MQKTLKMLEEQDLKDGVENKTLGSFRSYREHPDGASFDAREAALREVQ